MANSKKYYMIQYLITGELLTLVRGDVDAPQDFYTVKSLLDNLTDWIEEVHGLGYLIKCNPIFKVTEDELQEGLGEIVVAFKTKKIARDFISKTTSLCNDYPGHWINPEEKRIRQNYFTILEIPCRK